MAIVFRGDDAAGWVSRGVHPFSRPMRIDRAYTPLARGKTLSSALSPRSLEASNGNVVKRRDRQNSVWGTRKSARGKRRGIVKWCGSQQYLHSRLAADRQRRFAARNPIRSGVDSIFGSLIAL